VGKVARWLRNFNTRYAFGFAFVNGACFSIGMLAKVPSVVGMSVFSGVLLPLWLTRQRDQCVGCGDIAPLSNCPKYCCEQCLTK